MSSYFSAEQLSQAGKALVDNRKYYPKKKRHTLQSFNLQDVADACNVSIRTLQYKCKERGIDLKLLSLKELYEFIHSFQE